MHRIALSARPVPTVVLLLLALLAVPSLSAQQVEQYQVRGENVAIFNLAGEARIEAGAGPAVIVEVTRGGADARRLQVETGRLGDRETLRVIYPEDWIVYSRMRRGSRTQARINRDGTIGGAGIGGRRVTVTGLGDGLDAYADLRIRVPSGQRIAVYQAVGQVWVSNVDGELRVDAHSAEVQTTGTRGSLTVDTGSGSVQVQDAEGAVDLDTGSGRVEVSGVRGSRLRVDTGSGGVSGSNLEVASLTVDVGSGAVRLSGVHAGEAVIDTGSGSVNLALTGPVRSLRVDTGSGAVTLTVPRNQGADLEIDTGSGGISVDVPVQNTQQRRSYFRGRIGKGEGKIRIDTGSGAVRVRETVGS